MADDQENKLSAEELSKRFQSHDYVGMDGTRTPPTRSQEDSSAEETEEAAEDDESPEEQDDTSGEDQQAGSAEETEEETSGEESQEEASDEESSEEEEPHKKGKSARERIAELTKARREAERKAAELEQQLQQAQSQQQEQSSEGQQQDLTSSQQDDSSGEDAPPKPEDFEYGELDPRYIEALTDHRVKKTLSEHQKAEQERQQKEAAERHAQEFLQKYEERVAEGVKEFDDFEEVVVKGADEGKFPLTQTMAELAVNSDVGHKVAYHLATNVEEAKRIASLNPTEQAVAFGRLEARFSSGNSDAPKKSRAPKAPSPPRQARGAGGKFQVSPDTKDFRAFKEAMSAKGN